MQTSVRPAAHTTSVRNLESNFAPQNAARAGEKFGDVMERALTGSPRDSIQDDRAAQSREDQRATKARKPLRRELPKHDTTAQIPAANNCSIIHRRRDVDQGDPGHEGSSENESETGTSDGKHRTAVGNANDASPSVAPQSLGAPIPITAPTPVENVSAKAIASTSKPGLPLSAPRDAAETKTSVGDSGNASEADGINLAKDPSLPPAGPTTEKIEAIGMEAGAAANAQNDQSPQLKASADSASAFACDPYGTPAAKQDMTMKKAEKTPKVAGPAEQDLPGNTATGSEELPMARKLVAKALAHGNAKLDSTTAAEIPAASPISTSVESTAPTITTAAVAPAAEADTRLRVLERTHDIVALHAMRIGQSGSDSLHVVVKPGAGIQLSLELRKSEDGIEVRASLHKGDFEHLRQYWPQLQQRLESRGVRVGALTTSENFSSSSHQQFQQSKQQSSNQDALHAGAFAEFALAGSLAEAPATRAARATAYRGWETWA
jgi:hypothetical protein